MATVVNECVTASKKPIPEKKYEKQQLIVKIR